MGLIFSEANGFADSVFGKSAYPINMVMEQALESFEQNSAVDKIFNMRTSKHFAEKVTAMSAMDNWTPANENAAPALNEMGEVFSKVIEHTPWNSRFVITREMVDDAQLDVMRLRATKMVQAWGRTKEDFAAKMLAGGLGNSISYAGRNFDTTTADGKPLFSTAHQNFYKASKTQTNKFSDAFSNSVLAEMETRMQNFVGDKDEILGIAPDTIIIPNDGALKMAVFEAIGADKDPNTANNGFNYNFGRWTVIVNPYLKFTGADKPFILLDSHFNDVEGVALWYNRVNMEVKAFVDQDTNAAVYQGYARFGAGFNNWRGIAIGGVSGGTAL